MFYALSWFVVASLITLWSLAAWAVHAVATGVIWGIGSVLLVLLGAGLHLLIALWRRRSAGGSGPNASSSLAVR